MIKNAFIFDQNKCVGCHACVVACINENGFQSPNQWRNIHNSQENHLPDLPLFYLSLACNHCEDAPCLKNCPSLAYSHDIKTGAIIHDSEKCIGCKYCTWACPYDAPKYNIESGIVEKCTFCIHRIEENLKPACAHLCPTGALDVSSIEIKREESMQSSPVPVNVGSSLKTIKLRKNTSPDIDLILFEEQKNIHLKDKKYQKITAIKEWPLLLFTILSTALTSIYISGIANKFSYTHKHIFMLFAIAAALLSILHLGKKLRTWRSVLDVKNSWLSREIAFFILFLAGVFCDFYLFDLPNIFVSILGFLFLISIDLLYKIATWKWVLKIHSAQTVLIGLSLYSILIQSYYLFIFVIAFRLTIYVYRKFMDSNEKSILTIIRLLFTVIATIILYKTQYFIPGLVLFALGEIIDRFEFYNDLRVPDLQSEISYNK